MIKVIRVRDEDAAGETINELKLQSEAQSITVSELIEARVEHETKRFNLMRPVNFYMLVQPKGAQEWGKSYRLPEHRDLDPEAAKVAALAAFEKKRFFVLFNGKELKSLTDTVPLDVETSVSFVKLMSVIADS